MTFGTILADPPWAYQATTRHEKLTGYSDAKYEPLTTERLCSLPVRELAGPDSVLLLWATWPFIADALKVMDAWGFTFVTGLPWVKVTATAGGLSYGVGYWFRGCTEPLLVGKRKKAYRTNMAGILTNTAGADGIVAKSLSHSRKPEDVYRLAERLPGPYLELFARGPQRPGWSQCGNEHESTPGEDIAESVSRLLGQPAMMTPGKETITMTTFTAWLHDQEHRTDPVGWFACFWRDLPQKPRLSAPSSILGHLENRQLVTPDVQQAFDATLKEYRQGRDAAMQAVVDSTQPDQSPVGTAVAQATAAGLAAAQAAKPVSQLDRIEAKVDRLLIGLGLVLTGEQPDDGRMDWALWFSQADLSADAAG